LNIILNIIQNKHTFKLQRTIVDLLYSYNKYGFQEEKEDPRNLSNHHHLIGFQTCHHYHRCLCWSMSEVSKSLKK
jgi:hypothetical protein